MKLTITTLLVLFILTLSISYLFTIPLNPLLFIYGITGWVYLSLRELESKTKKQ